MSRTASIIHNRLKPRAIPIPDTISNTTSIGLSRSIITDGFELVVSSAI